MKAKNTSVYTRAFSIIRRNPNQWEKFKHYLRTGEKPKGLRHQTISEFSEIGLDHKETINRARRKPYKAEVSREQSAEIKKQVTDLITLLMPSANPGKRAKLIENLLKKFSLIKRKHVEDFLEDREYDGFFRSGRMYSHALTPKAKIPKKRKKTPNMSGFADHKIVLENSFMRSRYGLTTAFHEAAHVLIGTDEYKVHLADFYYSLKRGIMDVSYLKNHFVEEKSGKVARKRAIELYETGRREGWRKANSMLRNELGKLKIR